MLFILTRLFSKDTSTFSGADTLKKELNSISFHWNEQQTSTFNLQTSQHRGSDLIGQPLYISLTTIHRRLDNVVLTVASILEGSVVPDHIYLFVSKDPFLLDHGVSETQIKEQVLGPLLKRNITHVIFSVIYTENIGPHRKLLPLLSRMWNEDCVIIN